MSTLYVNTIVPNSGSTVNISGSLFVSGTINLGDANTDSVSFGAEISSSIIPDANDTYDLGSSAKSWKTIHGTSSLANTASHAAYAVTSLSASHATSVATAQSNITSLGTLTGLTVNGHTVIGSASATHKITGSVDIDGSVSASGNVSASNFKGSILQAGVTSTVHSAGTITGSGTIKGNKLISVTNVEAVSFTGSLSGSALAAVSSSYSSTATTAASATTASYVTGGAAINSGVINNITSLTAGGDLDIGTHAFRAQTLLADGLTSGRVVVAGTNGLLTDDADFSFATDTLTISKTHITTASIGVAPSNTTNPSGTSLFTAGNISSSGHITASGLMVRDEHPKLQIHSNAASGDGSLIFKSGDGSTMATMRADVTSNALNHLSIGAGTNETHLVVDANGKIGLGVQTPGEVLTVVGNISASGHVKAVSFTGSLSGSATNALLATTASYALVAASTATDLTPLLETKTAGFTAAAGREYIVNDADGAAIVLPSAVAGARITIVIGTLITSNTTTITAAGGDLLKGYAFLEATDAANNKTMFVPDGSDDLIITLNGSTKGGLVGDRIELVGISGTEWRVRATLSHTGTAATPFS